MAFLSRCRVCGALLLLLLLSAAPRRVEAQSIDIFSGIDFSLRDLNFQRQYDLLIRLTPGFRWDIGDHWQLTGQVVVPVLNQFGDRYGHVYPTNFAISKQMQLGPVYCKSTFGLFNYHRYGLDVKAFLPLCDWFALEAQANYTGILYMVPVWVLTKPMYWAGTIGGDIYLTRWNTQLRGVVGRYVYEDYGFEGEIMRHFKHVTLSLYGCWSSREMVIGSGELIDCVDAGFKVVAMLPPYHRKHRSVNFRPASNFGLTYTVMYHQFTNGMIRTDPEENIRDGWFDRDLLQWGHTTQPDFIYSDDEAASSASERKEMEE